MALLRPRPLNADNQIPTAKVIRQLMVLALVNGDGPPVSYTHLTLPTKQPV